MAYSDVIPGWVVQEWLEKHPAPERKEVENPRVTIPVELVTDCLIRYEFEGFYGTIAAYEDHPAFATVRRLLAARGYIEIPNYPCVNGDRVIKRFQFNGYQLEVGDTFVCAAAWNTHFKMEKTND